MQRGIRPRIAPTMTYGIEGTNIYTDVIQGVTQLAGIVRQGIRDKSQAEFQREGMDLRDKQFTASEEQRGITNTYNTEQQRLQAEDRKATAEYRQTMVEQNKAASTAQAEAAKDAAGVRKDAEKRQNRAFNMGAYETFGLMPSAFETEKEFYQEVAKNQKVFQGSLSGLNQVQASLDSVYQRTGGMKFDQTSASETTTGLNTILNASVKAGEEAFSFENSKVNADGTGIELYVSPDEMKFLETTAPDLAAIANVEGTESPKSVSFEKVGRWVSGEYAKMQGGPKSTKQAVDSAITANMNSPATNSFAREAQNQALNAEYRDVLRESLNEATVGLQKAYSDLEPATLREIYTEFMRRNSSDDQLLKAKEIALDPNASFEKRQQAVTTFNARMQGLVVEAQQAEALNAELGGLPAILKNAEDTGALNLAASKDADVKYSQNGSVLSEGFSDSKAIGAQNAAVASIMTSYHAESGASPGQSSDLEAAIKNAFTIKDTRLSFEHLFDLKYNSPKLYSVLESNGNILTRDDRPTTQARGTEYSNFKGYEAARLKEKGGIPSAPKVEEKLSSAQSVADQVGL